MNTRAAKRRCADALTTWLVLYPTITVVSWILGPWTSGLVLPLRTLTTTAIVVPLMVWLLMPIAVRIQGRTGVHSRR